jgi:hypothetical protein
MFRDFSNEFAVVRPVRRVNVDLTAGMLRELDARAARERQPPGGHQDAPATGVGQFDTSGAKAASGLNPSFRAAWAVG